MKVILDCNIWISFLLGHQTQLVRRILTDMRFDVYICEPLLKEIQDVVGRDKIRRVVSTDDVEDLFRIIQAFCQYATPEADVATNAVRDPKDLYLLSFAESIGATYIVSGDKDLTELGCHKQTKIVKLADFKSMMMYV